MQEELLKEKLDINRIELKSLVSAIKQLQKESDRKEREIEKSHWIKCNEPLIYRHKRYLRKFRAYALKDDGDRVFLGQTDRKYKAIKLQEKYKNQ